MVPHVKCRYVVSTTSFEAHWKRHCGYMRAASNIPWVRPGPCSQSYQTCFALLEWLEGYISVFERDIEGSSEKDRWEIDEWSIWERNSRSSTKQHRDDKYDVTIRAFIPPSGIHIPFHHSFFAAPSSTPLPPLLRSRLQCLLRACPNA